MRKHARGKPPSPTRIRKLETRRKIIAGGIALTHCQHDPEFKARFELLLDRFVRGDDRALFGLTPTPTPAEPANDDRPPPTQAAQEPPRA